MSREVNARWVADGKVRDAIIPQIINASFRIERLIEQMAAGENPEINPQRIDEILDACVSLRVYAEKIR